MLRNHSLQLAEESSLSEVLFFDKIESQRNGLALRLREYILKDLLKAISCWLPIKGRGAVFS